MSVKPMAPFFKEIKEPVELVMTGNYAVAGGVTQTDPDVICAFPITPQTQSVEGLSDVVHQGRLNAAFVNVESELAACAFSTAACATGARTFTATASQGLLLMTEALPMAPGWRVPLTMLISARAFNSPNLSIWNSWEFTLLSSFGWNTIVSENVQETYDASIIASKISEDSLFPTQFVHDGFITSHSAQKFMAIPDEDVLKYSPKKPRHHINPEKTGTWGGIVTPGYFNEGRLSLELEKEKVLDQMEIAFRDFEKLTGRAYKLIETYNIDCPSKTVFLTMGSMCGNIITWMNEGNNDIGLIKLRAWRPFPSAQIRKIVEDHHIEKIIVLEKNDDLSNALPPVASNLASALFGLNVVLRSFIVGLGGRDVTKDELIYSANKMKNLTDNRGRLYDYLGVRETKNKMFEVRF
ncbi:MAG: pyruvate ferredoxin oxidoreductase [Promethearchaeota archaeon]